jgi:hypothetical protein
VKPIAKWSVPRMWESETVAVLASGHSMSRDVARRVREAGLRAIAVNTTYQIATFADMVYASDVAWWRQYHANVRTLCPTALLVSVSQTAFADVLVLATTGREGFDPNPSAVRDGGNSGYAAIHVAAHAGAKRIVLCGFDMNAGPRGATHWHGQHPSALRNAGTGIFERWIARYATLGSELAKRGIEVVNCSPNSALRAFPIVTLEEALRESAVPVS